MSLAQITEKISSDARAAADKILKEAREQETKIKEDASAEVRQIEESTKERFEKERPEIFKRRDIVAKLDINKLHLKTQRDLIRDVFNGALDKLRNLDKDHYLKFCHALLKKAVVTGKEVLTVAKDEKFISSDWLKQFNSENNTEITMSPTHGDFTGGFVLTNGRVDVNCSWEMLVQNAQENMETEVVRRLFPA